MPFLLITEHPIYGRYPAPIHYVAICMFLTQLGYAHFFSKKQTINILFVKTIINFVPANKEYQPKRFDTNQLIHSNKMAVYLTTQKRQEIFETYGGSAQNSGATESQVALFTYRINELSKHLKANKKDFSCQRALLKLVGKRKKLLHYMMQEDIVAYRSLLEKLELRK